MAVGYSQLSRICTTAAKEPKLLDNMCSFFTPVLASNNYLVIIYLLKVKRKKLELDFKIHFFF